jgi:hypothetical protein
VRFIFSRSRLCFAPAGECSSTQVPAIPNDGVPEVLSLLVFSEAIVHIVASLLTDFKTADADQCESLGFCGLRERRCPDFAGAGITPRARVSQRGLQRSSLKE